MKQIKIQIRNFEFVAHLLENPTANDIYNALPFEGQVQTWGNEIYFTVPVEANEEPEAKEVLDLGDLAFWPPGSAFCIFFGSTPVSQKNEPRAASPVNVFGKIVGNTENLKKIDYGEKIKVSKF